MTVTVKSDVLIPEILAETVQGAFAQKNAFMGSQLAQLGIVVVDGSFPGKGPEVIGNEVTIPYFGTLGEFAANADGSAVTPNAVKMTNEKSTVARSSLAFEVSVWASGGGVSDPYAEAANQIVAAAQREMDKRVMTAAVATGGLRRDVYSASIPVQMSYDLVVDTKLMWGDEGSDVVAMAVHSKTMADMLKLKDSTGMPLLTLPQDGKVARFVGLPVIESDRLPLTGSSMGSVTSTGTSPPVLTITGTPTGPWSLVIECQVGGAHTTATYRFSTDGGNTWSADITTLGAGVAQALTDTATDSLVGANGTTGLSVAFAAGTFNADNDWKSTAVIKATSLLLKRNSLAFWYNRNALTLETDRDILAHTKLGAMHLYYAAHRYRRVRGGTKPGVAVIQHNVG